MAKTILSLNERSIDNLNNEEKVQEKEKSSEGLVLKSYQNILSMHFWEKEGPNL